MVVGASPARTTAPSLVQRRQRLSSCPFHLLLHLLRLQIQWLSSIELFCRPSAKVLILTKDLMLSKRAMSITSQKAFRGVVIIPLPVDDLLVTLFLTLDWSFRLLSDGCNLNKCISADIRQISD